MGSALALSIAGYFATNLRLRPHNPPPSSSPAKTGAQLNGIRARRINDELRILSNEEELAKIINGTSIITTVIDEEGFLKKGEQFAKIVHGTSITRVIDEEEFLKKEVNFTSISTMKNMIDASEYEKLELKHEIARLKNLVEAFKERERALEVQLLDALKNRIKINNIKFKSAREEIKDSETKFQDTILEDEESSPEVEKQLARAKELEEEAFDLRRENSRLTDENSKLVHHLESAKMAAASNLEDLEDSSDLQAEASRLREENEKSRKEIEQLQTDRGTDAEELVYVRWVNECMRYELRNHQHSLSKSTRSSKSRFLGKIRKLVSKDKTHGSPTSSFTSSRRSFDSISSFSEGSRRRFSSFS